jgi:hypothetical protein
MTQITNLYAAMKVKDNNYVNRVNETISDDSLSYTSVVTKHNQLLSLILKTIDPTKRSIIGNIYFNSQITSSNPDTRDDFVSIAKYNNLTIVSYNDCATTLKNYYNLRDDILVVKSEAKIPGEKGTLKNNLAVQYYGIKSRKPLDESQCHTVKGYIEIPINVPDNQKSRYVQYKGLGIDVYNPMDPAFRTRCYTFTDPDNGYDTTLNYRITNYFKNRTECLDNGCTYRGLTLDWLINCDCGESTDNAQSDPYESMTNILSCTRHVSVVNHILI